ncbi:MAG: hypothetical protein CVV27_09745 [Candidatus Melainabacteria bacterium HGW-Melainabacteria-1]|nr:MAG: hypothetical protein CVV27_09745 [Candidatus Melainabacteria bacterium HGW-Melainabacteria-1]
MDFYDQHFALLARSQSTEQLQQIIDFVLARLALAPGSGLLDQGCGIGRISHLLANAGLQVTGVDINSEYIREARANTADLPLRYVCADARDFVCEPALEAVLSWHTSFGHFTRAADNQAMLARAYDSLLPGGRLLLDYPNFYQTLINFQSVLVQSYTTEAGLVRVMRHSRIDPGAGLLHQDWEFIYPDGERALRHAPLSIYLPHQLEQMLQNAGFILTNVYGSVAGEPFELDSPRWIVLAHKGGTP